MNAALIVKILNMIQGAFDYLVARGISRDRIQIMLDDAGDNDITTEQVQNELDLLSVELDETERMINP